MIRNHSTTGRTQINCLEEKNTSYIGLDAKLELLTQLGHVFPDFTKIMKLATSIALLFLGARQWSLDGLKFQKWLNGRLKASKL